MPRTPALPDPQMTTAEIRTTARWATKLLARVFRHLYYEDDVETALEVLREAQAHVEDIRDNMEV